LKYRDIRASVNQILTFREGEMSHSALAAGKRAVITGGADGIGLAIAKRFAGLGMELALVDLGADRLARAKAALETEGAANVTTHATDVSDAAALSALAGDLGTPDVLVCNAGIQPGSKMFADPAGWRRILEVNFWGVVNACNAFVPGMVAKGGPGLVINTGSKQGITTPPGDPAYNVSKSALKTFTEALAHELRNGPAPEITAHLLIPGFVFTELTRPGESEKPSGAWLPEQVADFMIQSLERGDFYILCPDDDVSRELDEKRIAWAAGDIIENRPPLSRWHKDWGAAFQRYLDKG
jgi:hypothetical protein